MAKQTVKSLHTDEYDKLLALLREKRLEAKATRQGLSLELGQAKNYIAKIEDKDRRVDAVELLFIASALGIDPVQFFAEFVQAVSENR